jgi:hypothetical protein
VRRVKQRCFTSRCTLAAKSAFRALEINLRKTTAASDQYAGFTGSDTGLATGATGKKERSFARPWGADRIRMLTPLSAEQSASRQFGHAVYP